MFNNTKKIKIFNFSNNKWSEKDTMFILVLVLSVVSALAYMYYLYNGLGLAYNDARSHLDIGRRVIEGLKPGVAQLGSVWLPLTHFLMILTIWNDFMWHSGLAGAILSMFAFVGTGVLIYSFLRELSVGIVGRLVGVLIFVLNINILYLQSTAMTELILLATMTAGAYYLLMWFKNDKLYYILMSAFWIMLATLVRYDGWFLFLFAAVLVILYIWKSDGFRKAEGLFILFCSLGGFGIVLWFMWNLLIFGDPLYFMFGPYSAHTQQEGLEAAGILATKGDWGFSAQMYLYAMAYNSGAFIMFLGFFGAIRIWFDHKITTAMKVSTLALLAPLFFNILALYLGHSVLFVAALSGESWFNVRYGIMMMPSFAIFIGYLLDRTSRARWVIIAFLVFLTVFMFKSGDAVTIDDALIGSSQKNVTEVSNYLRDNATDNDGFILISVASHDAIIFSSGLPMSKYIHEGTGRYYSEAIQEPDKWARWIVVRSNSDSDTTWTGIKDKEGFKHFELVDHYPFADIYELKSEYVPHLITEPIYEDEIK
ncbi:hypothetical protein ACFLZ9_01305 [Patescibacteria group bacterium]